jgi:hypothetical protein
MEIACRRQVIAQISGQNSNHRNFSRASAIAKNMVFNVKKLLNDGMELTLARGQKEAMLVE